MKKIHPSAQIHPTAVIYDNVEIGPDVVIGPLCIIGAQAESKNNWVTGSVLIEEGSILHGLVTVDASTKDEAPTIIGPYCYLMKHVHIGHDAMLIAGVTIAPNSSVGGHCVIGPEVGIGMNACIHQRVTVARGCFIGAGSVLPRGFESKAERKYVGVGRDIGPNIRK